MKFATPELVVLAAAVPIAVLLIALADRSRRRVLLGRLGESEAVQRMMASVSPGRRRLKRVLVATGVAMIVVAAARPGVPGHTVRGTEGLDLVVAVDVSKSMLVPDVGGTRLERVRDLVGELFERIPNDRVAPVVFAGAAAHFPLTEDKDVAGHFLADLGPADLPGGSELDEALRVSRCILRPAAIDAWSDDCGGVGGRGHGGDPKPGEDDDDLAAPVTDQVETSERAKVVLLFTDGADGLGDSDDDAEGPIRQAATANQLGITVLVVGVGTETGGQVPALDYRGEPHDLTYDDDGRPVVSRLQPAALRLLAEAGGDRDHYYQIGAEAFDVAVLERALDKLQRGALERRDVPVTTELYHFFLFPGFLLLVIEACIGNRRRLRHPEGEA